MFPLSNVFCAFYQCISIILNNFLSSCYRYLLSYCLRLLRNSSSNLLIFLLSMRTPPRFRPRPYCAPQIFDPAPYCSPPPDFQTLRHACNKSFRKDEPLTSWTQHICPHFWAWLLLYSAITPKSEDKYDVKVFNWSEFHLSEMTLIQNPYFRINSTFWIWPQCAQLLAGSINWIRLKRGFVSWYQVVLLMKSSSSFTITSCRM